MIIVIDTNLWISTLLHAGMRKRIEAIIENPDIVILGSPVLLAEMESVANRPKFDKHIPANIAAIFFEIIRHRMDVIFPSSETQGFSDQKDNYLLSIAKDGNASLILTGDKKMLETVAVEGIRIISLSAFEKEFLDKES